MPGPKIALLWKRGLAFWSSSSGPRFQRDQLPNFIRPTSTARVHPPDLRATGTRAPRDRPPKTIYESQRTQEAHLESRFKILGCRLLALRLAERGAQCSPSTGRTSRFPRPFLLADEKGSRKGGDIRGRGRKGMGGNVDEDRALRKIEREREMYMYSSFKKTWHE
ncbi:hypothetical protein KM043_010177 [Ampulex compressa]|nr:hypothetical protein KM043_010177 [Ampulex compressa]